MTLGNPNEEESECNLKKKPANLVSIRLAKIEDSLAVSSLLSEWLKLPKTDARLNQIKKAIREREILVAVDPDKRRVVGFVHAILHNDPISGGQLVYVTAFYGRKDFREMGVGFRLLKILMARAAKNGAVGAEVSTTSRRAIKLYRRLGFKQFKGDIGEILLGLDFADVRGKV